MYNDKISYPYIPNSVPEIKSEMMKEVGVTDEMQLFEEIPKQLMLDREMNLPEPILDEFSIKKHIEKITNKNSNTNDNLCFLGAGCAPHFIPAVCDEINGRSEFLTAYAGGLCDHGKLQSMFEYASLMAELLDTDCLTLPQYDGGNSAAHALRMASRITGRTKVLLPRSMCPDNLLIIKTYLTEVQKNGNSGIEIVMVDFDVDTGLLDLNDLKKKISSDIAAVFIENPSYLGVIETQCAEIGEIAQKAGSEFIVSTDPIALCVLEAPINYGATITCGDIHPLGIHMQCGGGVAGFVAVKDDEKYVNNLKDFMIAITPTIVGEEFAFTFGAMYERTSHGSREKGHEYSGTGSALYAITAAVYLASMGPKGMQEVGTTIMQRSQYALKQIAEIPGVEVQFTGPFFKEFVVNFDMTGKTVAEINKKLLGHNVFGGKDISAEFPELGQSALYCVTEVHNIEDINKLAYALKCAVN